MRAQTVYVQLLDEGFCVWRPVQAVHSGGDRYRLGPKDDDDEVWEFQPGDLVRCRLIEFENGTCLAAFERIGEGG